MCVCVCVCVCVRGGGGKGNFNYISGGCDLFSTLYEEFKLWVDLEFHMLTSSELFNLG